MIYIICKIHNADGVITSYTGFDTWSDSTMSISTKLLKSILIAGKIMVVNASIEDNNIILKDWIYGLASNHGKIYGNLQENKYSGPGYVLITAEFNRYKIVSCKCGNVYHANEKDFKNLVRSAQIANCNTVRGKTGDTVLMTDVCKIYRDGAFDKRIRTKYNAFIAKTILLGYGDITFKYTTENHEVKLTRYTGLSKNVILPPFITSIMRGAFSGLHLETIEFSEGIRVIGEQSFGYNNLESVEIPESVEIIGTSAFEFNPKLFDSSNNLHKDRFKLRNSKTLVLRACG